MRLKKKDMKNRFKTGLAGLLLAGTVLLSGCTKSTDETVEVNKITVPTLYSVVGTEYKITGSGVGTENGSKYKYLDYKEVSSEDAINYIIGLKDYDYYIVNGSNDEDDSATEINMETCKQLDDTHVLDVKAVWTGETTEITYTYTVGTLTVNDIEE